MRFQSSAYGDSTLPPEGLRRLEWFAPLRAENRQPLTADVNRIPRGSGHTAITAQIAANYGPFPAGISYREVAGVKAGTPLPNTVGQSVPGSAKDGYIYRQYKTGEISIEQSPAAPTGILPDRRRTTDGGDVTTTGGGTGTPAPEKKLTQQGWFWPATILGASALIAGGVFLYAKRKGATGVSKGKGKARAAKGRKAARRKSR